MGKQTYTRENKHTLGKTNIQSGKQTYTQENKQTREHRENTRDKEKIRGIEGSTTPMTQTRDIRKQTQTLQDKRTNNTVEIRDQEGARIG